MGAVFCIVVFVVGNMFVVNMFAAVLIDCFRLVPNMDEISLNIDEMCLNIDEMCLNIDEMSLNIDEMSLNIDEMSLNIDEMCLNIDEMSNSMVLDIDKVVLPNAPD